MDDHSDDSAGHSSDSDRKLLKQIEKSRTLIKKRIHQQPSENAKTRSNKTLPDKNEVNKNPPVVDHTTLWTRIFRQKRRFNRMDPDPDLSLEKPRQTQTGQSNLSRQTLRQKSLQNKEETMEQILQLSDWDNFWVGRLRKLIDAPHITDMEIIGIVDKYRRMHLTKEKVEKEKEKEVEKDPYLPPCFYWDKAQVAEWVDNVGLPDSIKEITLNNNISGRQLIMLDASTLTKMGLYDLDTIKMVTKAVRQVLGLPSPNGLRAIGRISPLEEFLKLKLNLHMSPAIKNMTFKQFCESEGINLTAATESVMVPGCVKVHIKPDSKEDIDWIPVTPPTASRSGSNYDYHPSSSSGSSSEISLEGVPTVEQLATNAFFRNSFIPQLLNDIIEDVFAKVHLDGRSDSEEVAQQTFKNYLEATYSHFSIMDPNEQLKLVTIIAEELVDDILRAREVLEDIDNFQRRMKTDVPEEDKENVQDAVSFYVQSIMPLVVSAALKEMEEGSVHRFETEDLATAEVADMYEKLA